jgi:alkylhydroperoxidase family enzyme
MERVVPHSLMITPFSKTDNVIDISGMEPRLPPVPPKEWPAAMRDALAALRPAGVEAPPTPPGRPKGLNALGTFAHYPELTKAFFAFNGHVLFGSTISARQRELLILRVAARRDAAYEWAQHVVLAGDAGLAPDEIERVRLGPDANGWAPIDHALLRAVDELLDDARIGDATWTALSAELDPRQLIDVVFTVGAYETIAMFFKTMGVELDPDLS